MIPKKEVEDRIQKCEDGFVEFEFDNNSALKAMKGYCKARHLKRCS